MKSVFYAIINESHVPTKKSNHFSNKKEKVKRKKNIRNEHVHCLTRGKEYKFVSPSFPSLQTRKKL